MGNLFKQTSLRINVIANFFGRISVTFFGLLFTPLYIYFLGIESYGLIGFYLTLQGSMTFLEMGLSRACNRELARHSGKGKLDNLLMRNTLRTLEVVYWIISLLIVGGISLISSWIAGSWLSTNLLPLESLQNLILIMAWVIALRWPTGLYQGALMGLQEHVKLNFLQVLLSLLSGGGAVLVLWQIEASIKAYFLWQLFSTLFSVLLYKFLAWQSMPIDSKKPCFSFGRLRKVYSFAAGVGINAVIGTALRQADKIIVSAFLSLKEFSYYILAALIVQVITMTSNTISNTVFPRLSQMLGSNKHPEQVSRLYHFSSQIVAVLIVPLALMLFFFAEQALYVYSGNTELAYNVAPILSVLAIAKMFNASMTTPYALQLAHGWVSLSIYLNIASFILLIPLIYLLVINYGSIGASYAWLIISLLYVLIAAPLMHRKLMPGEALSWLLNCLVIPCLTIGAILYALRGFISLSDNRWFLGIELLIFGVGAIILSCSVNKLIRERIKNEIMRKIKNIH